MSRHSSLVLFLLAVVGGGLAIGAGTTPGVWYAQLEKPAFTPPGWLFGPVWTALYVVIAVAGWRIWQHHPHGTAMRLWWAQLFLNFLWSPVFFVAHQVGLALAVVLALVASVVAFIATAARHDRPAAWLFVPYAAWAGFASVLNASILVLN
jgi:translocator protein